MQTWNPDLSKLIGPRYRAIADALANDIESGRLSPGSRLPTHRELAWRLGVTVGTVTRAYSEAERRGLIGGEVGRGTFIRQRQETNTVALPGPGLIDMALNLPMGGSEAAELSRTLARLSSGTRVQTLLGYQPHLGNQEHREAMAAFLRNLGIETTAERTILTAGAQHALTMAITAILRPGEMLGCEALTYGGLRSAARMLHLKLRGLAIDEEGICPDALEQAAKDGLKAFYCVPTLHNPTGMIWSMRRRLEILEVARRHGVMVIEDDVYGFLVEDAPPPLVDLAPDIVFHVNSTSKSLSPSLRIGCLVAPLSAAQAIASGVRTTIWMAPPLMAEVVRMWVEDGIAQRLVREKRAVGAERNAASRRILAGHGVAWREGHPNAFHLWIPLPEPWHDDSFVAEARQRGVLVSPAWGFAVGRRQTDAVRVSLGSPGSLAEIERGITTLARLIAEESVENGVI